MGDTYCGKLCEECSYRVELQCPGCTDGPGNHWDPECELAKCCIDKGHRNCTTCSYKSSCSKLQMSDNMPERRIRDRELEKEKRERMSEKSGVLGQWLWLLFWLVIPGVIAGIMMDENVVNLAPWLYFPGLILDIVTHSAYGLILIKISSEDSRYRTAGICRFVNAGINLIMTVVSMRYGEATWLVSISLLAVVASMAGEYSEYYAHSDVVGDTDPELSDKWIGLWKWYFRTFVRLLCSIVIVLMNQVLGLLVALAALIGTISVSIMKLVYLYRSARLFRDYRD